MRREADSSQRVVWTTDRRKWRCAGEKNITMILILPELSFSVSEWKDMLYVPNGPPLAYPLSQNSWLFDRMSSMSPILKPFTLFNSRVWSTSPIPVHLCSSQFTKGDFRVCFKTAMGLPPTILMLQLLFLLNRSSSSFFYSLTHVPAFVFIFLLDCSKGIDKKFSIQNSFVNVAVANWDCSIMPTFSNVTYVK